MNVLPTRAFALVARSTFRSLVLACVCVAFAAQSPAFSQGAAESSFEQLYKKLYAQIETLDAQREYVKADRLMKRLIDTAGKSFGPKSDQSIYMLHHHLVRLNSRGESRAALPIAVDLIPLLESRVGKLPLGPAMLQLTLVFAILGSESEAADDHSAPKRWLERLEALLSGSSPGDNNFMSLVQARASVARATNDRKLVIDAWRQQLAHMQATAGPDSPAAMQTMGRLALELAANGDADDTVEARQIADRLDGMCAGWTVVKNQRELIAMGQLAVTYARVGDEVKAEAAVNRIVNSPISFDPQARNDRGTDAEFISESLMGELNSVAIACRDAHKPAVAIPLFRYVIAKRIEKQPEDSSGVLRAKGGLGRALLLAGRKDEGVALITEAYETAAKTPKAHELILPALELGVAIGQEYAGSHQEARRTYEDSVDHALAIEQNELARRQVAQLYATAFADALEQSGRTDEAAEVRRKANSEQK